MVKELNRNYKQSMTDARIEFPNSHILMTVESALDDDGFVVAVSDDTSTEGELNSLRSTFPQGTIFFLGGVYKNGLAIGIQNVISQ